MPMLPSRDGWRVVEGGGGGGRTFGVEYFRVSDVMEWEPLLG